MSALSRDPATIRFVDVDGVRLRTSVRGSGVPLLVISGLGASLDVAEPFERELVERGMQVVSFDAPGVGESTTYGWPRRMPGVAGTVRRMVEVLGYDRIDVLGVSLGGAVAQQLAHRAPSLVLAATAPGLGGVPGSPAALLALATPRRYHQPDYYRRIAGRVYGGLARTDPDLLLRGSVARFVEPPTLRGYLGQLSRRGRDGEPRRQGQQRHPPRHGEPRLRRHEGPLATAASRGRARLERPPGGRRSAGRVHRHGRDRRERGCAARCDRAEHDEFACGCQKVGARHATW